VQCVLRRLHSVLLLQGQKSVAVQLLKAVGCFSRGTGCCKNLETLCSFFVLGRYEVENQGKQGKGTGVQHHTHSVQGMVQLLAVVL
jgi:hypothetical protein